MTAPTITESAVMQSPSPGSNQTPLFGAHPAQQGLTTLPGGHFNYALVPGGTVTDGVVVENFTGHSLDFHIYGADLLLASGGGLSPAQPSATMREAGAWIAISKPMLTVAANSQSTDMFTVTAPAAVSPGEHLGAVVAAARVGTTPQGSSIEARTALITVVTVPGIAHPSATLNPLSRSPAVPAQLGFDITLSNTGNLLLTYTGTVVVRDDGGRQVASLSLAPPGAYVVPAGRIPLAAVWRETVPQSGAYSAQATVSILADGKPVATLTSQSLELPMPSGAPILLIIGIAALVVLIIAGGTWFMVRRARNSRRSRRARHHRSSLERAR